MVEFQDYPNVLIRMLNNCIKQHQSHLAVFVMQHDVNARLDFIQVVGLVIRLVLSTDRVDVSPVTRGFPLKSAFPFGTAYPGWPGEYPTAPS